MTNIWNRLRHEPWIWSFLAAVGVWLATIAYTGGQGAGEILTAALSFATFSIIVGLGQMMVITTGPGNVDLSIPATITLAGVVAMKVMDTDSAMLLLGIGAALGVSFLVGVFNYSLIRLLRYLRKRLPWCTSNMQVRPRHWRLNLVNVKQESIYCHHKVVGARIGLYCP